MLSRRSVHTAAAVAALATATTASARGFSSSSHASQIWMALSGDGVTTFNVRGRPWTLRVPLEVSVSPAPTPSASYTAVAAASRNAAGHTGLGVLHCSRTLLAPQPPSSTTPTGSSSTATAVYHATAEAEGEPRGPYDVTVDEVLAGNRCGPATVLDLVHLLVDPDAGPAQVEAVTLRDFTAMAPKRQLRAVNNDRECLDILLSSERYQGERDARTLRLAGVTTVGQWREQPDRVPLSAYGRGVLEAAYNALVRNRQQSQKDLVVAWLTRTIQRAVAEELMAPKQLPAGGEGSMTPSLQATSAEAGDRAPSPSIQAEAAETAKAAAVTAFTTTFASPAREAPAKAKAQNSVEVEVAEEEEEKRDAAVSHRRGPRKPPISFQVTKGRGKDTTTATVEEEFEVEVEEVEEAEDEADDEALEEIIDEIDAERGEEVDAEMAELMAEAEAVLKNKRPPAPPKSAPAVKASTATAAAATPPAVSGNTAAQPKTTKETTAAPHAEGEEEEEVEEVEEVVEEVEEEEGEAAPDKDVSAPKPASPAATAPAGAPTTTTTTAHQKEKLARLAELMLKQFNTADGYLHPTSKAERTEQEQRGDILVLDEDTAQVDPLAMFSAYHAATVTDADPMGVRALKTIWTAFNKHQIALEEATSEAAAEFYKHESVNALLYGSVLMRALAREEPVMVLEGTSAVPRYGFPLVSSDTRPFNTGAAMLSSSTAVSAATDMTPGTVPTAMQAYKIFFSDKEKRYSPFRPAIDQNRGCSVVRLSGTTLHLYYTSTKDHVMEEEVRLPFAEVMLGMLHLLRQKVLPRVNVVHYHLIATKVADAAADTNFLLRSTATLDLTNPFTAEEHAQLKALAAPLGMSEEMDEFRCIDDLVMEIEDNSGASVVHSLLHNREDLEATLTATLAQLLPEDVEGGDADEKTEAAADGSEEVEEAAPPAEAAEDDDDGIAEQDDDAEEVEVMEEEEEEAPQPAAARSSGNTHPAKKPPHHHPASSVAPTTHRSAAAPAAAKANVEVEEAELEEAIYSQWQKKKEQQQRGGHTAGAKTSAAARTTAAPAAEFEEEIEEEEEEFEEEEEEEVTSPAAAVAHKPRTAARSHHPSQPAAHTRAAPVADEEAIEEEEEEVEVVEEEEGDDDDDVEVVTTPVLPRSPAGRRAVPVKEDADVEAVPPQRQQQRVTRHPTPPAPAAAVAAAPPPPMARAQPPPQVTADDASMMEADVAPPLPRVRTRRGAARRRATRAHAAVSPEEERQRAGGNDDYGGTNGGDTADNAPVEDEEDQWFRKKPKRRYSE